MPFQYLSEACRERGPASVDEEHLDVAAVGPELRSEELRPRLSRRGIGIDGDALRRRSAGPVECQGEGSCA